MKKTILYAVSMVVGSNDKKGHSIVMQIDKDIKESDVSFAPIAVLAVNKDGSIDIVNFLKQIPKDAHVSYTTDSDSVTPEDFNLRGESYYSKQEYRLAINCFTKAIDLDPNYVIAYHNRGNALRERGAYGLAILDFNTAMKLETYANVYVDRGLVYFDEYLYDLSIADFNRAISIDSNCARAYYERSNAYYEKGDHDLSLLDLYKVIETSTDDRLAQLASDAITRLKTG
jgi:tetratricopeptide (TPR) repeat protein